MRGSFGKRSSCVRKSKNELLKMSHKDMFMELIRDIASELDVNVLCHKILVNVITLVRPQQRGCQTNDKVGQFRLPIESANKNHSSVMQKSVEFVCH